MITPSGQWGHFYNGSGANIGASGASLAEFLGDGDRHSVTTSGAILGGTVTIMLPTWGNGIAGLGNCVFLRYGDGLWYHLDLYGAAYSLGATAASFDSFVGSGDQYAITLGGCDWHDQ